MFWFIMHITEILSQNRIDECEERTTSFAIYPKCQNLWNSEFFF